MISVDVPSSPLLYKIILFAGFPIISISYMLLGLGSKWSPLIIVGAAGTMFFIQYPLISSYAKYSAGRPTIFVFLFIAFICSLIIHPQGFDFVLEGFFSFFVVFSIIIYVLKKNNYVASRLVNIDKCKTLLSYWIIYVLASSIPTSMGLSRLGNFVNVFSIFIFGLVFGWFGPEVTFRIVDGGDYRYLKALALGLALFFIIGTLYGIVLAEFFALSNFANEGPIVLMTAIIVIPSMLISRLTYEVIKT